MRAFYQCNVTLSVPLKVMHRDTPGLLAGGWRRQQCSAAALVTILSPCNVKMARFQTDAVTAVVVHVVETFTAM